MKKHFKNSIRVLIEADCDPVKVVIRLSKTQLLAALDYLLPTTDEIDPAIK